MLPPARKGAKCAVSGWSRAKMQQLIYGIPSAGIIPKVAYKHVPGGRGGKGRIYVNVPSLQRHMLGECEVAAETIDAVSILSQSPDWCQSAIHSLLHLVQDRAGLTAADFLTYIKSNYEPRNHHRTDPAANHGSQPPANQSGGKRGAAA